MLLSIIILNYKKKELTLKCIDSLILNFDKELSQGEIEVIIVDNNSLDDSVSSIGKFIESKNKKNISLINNSSNAGFGGGCNLGASKAKGDILLFLNNDTVIKDKSILKMANYMQENRNASILGGALVNPDGSEQSSSGKFFSPLNTSLYLLGLQKLGLVNSNPKTISEVDWVKGALFMIRKNVLEKLNGFDEKIFMYTEDMELCLRAKKAGFKTYFFTDTRIIHLDQGSSDRTFAIINIYKNLLYFFKKHKSNSEYKFIKFILEIKALLLISYGKITHNTYLVSTYEQALKAIR